VTPLVLLFTPNPRGNMTKQLFAAALSTAVGSVVAIIIFRKINP
jgi:hypothetical protein